MNSGNYFLGVDGGASKTAAVVTDESGHPLGRGMAGGSNHLRVGIELATRNVERAVNIALVEAGIAIRQIEYAYCGIAGSDHPAHHEKVVEALSVFFPGGNFVVDTDARIALTGAVGFAAGVVIISGTGSVAFGRNARGGEGRAGGWGPTLGDEGSGYAIAREGLAAIVRAHDGRAPQTAMTDLLCREYLMCQPADLPRFVYATTTHADDIARFGRLVMEAATDGDPVAASILEHGGRELDDRPPLPRVPHVPAGGTAALRLRHHHARGRHRALRPPGHGSGHGRRSGRRLHPRARRPRARRVRPCRRPQAGDDGRRLPGRLRRRRVPRRACADRADAPHHQRRGAEGDAGETAEDAGGRRRHDGHPRGAESPPHPPR